MTIATHPAGRAALNRVSRERFRLRKAALCLREYANRDTSCTRCFLATFAQFIETEVEEAA
jgi:hypothetical protein